MQPPDCGGEFRETAMIKIVADSTANIPAQVVSEFDIRVIPTYVHFGSETFLDGVTLTPTDFYKRMVASTVLPTTSQMPVEDFKKVYTEVFSQQPDATILSIHLSAALSGIIESARGAANAMPGAKIRIFDTRSVGPGHALMAREAARMAKEGAEEADILKRLEHMRDHMRQFWVFDTLEYLAKSGRIGRAARLLGGLLDLKPILTLKNGSVDPHGRQRGKATAISSVREMAVQEASGKSGVQIGVVHAAAEEEAKKVAEDLRTAIKPDLLLILELGPSVGSYSGPGAIGITWYIPEPVTLPAAPAPQPAAAPQK
jgi:DegV family protein with EDD domain